MTKQTEYSVGVKRAEVDGVEVVDDTVAPPESGSLLRLEVEGELAAPV